MVRTRGPLPVDARTVVGPGEAVTARAVARPAVADGQRLAGCRARAEEQLAAEIDAVVLEVLGVRSGQLLLPAQRELEREHGVELGLGGQPEVDTGHPIEPARKVLDHGADRELAQGAAAGRAVVRPAGGRRLASGARLADGGADARVRPDGLAHAQRVRHAAQHARLVEAVEILEDQAEAAHQVRVLELAQGRVELGHEQRVAPRQLGDERRIDGEVVVGRMAGGAGPAVAAEGLVLEQAPAALDQVRLADAAQALARLDQPQDRRIDLLMGQRRVRAGRDRTGHERKRAEPRSVPQFHCSAFFVAD